MKKRLLAVLLLCILTLCFNVQSFAFGSYYNSEDVYFGKLPPVGNQMEFSDCWSYAAIGAAEYSMAVNDNEDFSDEKNLFSEHHMAASMNATNDPNFKLYTRTQETGGGSMAAVAYMARSTAGGPVLHKDYTTAQYRYYISSRTDYRLLTLKKKQATLTKAHFITNDNEGSSILSFTVDEDDNTVKDIKYGKNIKVIESIKEAVVAYGAVSTSYYAYEKDEKTYFEPKTAAFYVPWEDYINAVTPDSNRVIFGKSGYEFTNNTNHNVMIVGWDDDFSYENFKNTPVSFDGEEYTCENGAWIVKNSWGDDFGNDGYEYISYMDPTIGRSVTAYELERTCEQRAYTHSERGLVESVKFQSSPRGVYITNRYKTDSDLLTAVGLYICDTKPSVEVFIDTDAQDEIRLITDDEFENGKAVLKDWETGEEAEVLTFDRAGYYLYRLKTPIKVSGYFDVCVRYKLKEKGSIDIPASKGLEDDIEYVPNVCYWSDIKPDGGVREWKSINTNWCINMFATYDSFDVPKIARDGKNIKLSLYRYNENEEAAVYLVYYKDGAVAERKSFTPQFDEYGYWEICDKTDVNYDNVKALVWEKGILRPLTRAGNIY